MSDISAIQQTMADQINELRAMTVSEEIQGCGHQECGRFDPTWATCLVAGTVMDSSDVTIWLVPELEEITSCPDYDYELGMYVHVKGCDCARRESE